jgi:hypothetical protein
MMADSAYYRAEALRMLEWAESSPSPEMARRWRRLADDYVSLAERLDTIPDAQPPFRRIPIHQQPMQQQQAKSEPDDKE